MSRPSQGNLAAWLRGGQTIGHTFDMIREVLKRIMVVLILWAAFCIVCVNLRANEEEQTFGTLAMMAEVLDWVGPPAPQILSVPTPGRGPRPYSVEEVYYLNWVQPLADAYYHHARLGFLLWLIGAVGLGFATTRWYTTHGQNKLKTRQIKGQVVVRASELVAQIEAFNAEERKQKAHPDHIAPRLAGVPYPFDGEKEHTLITGSSGSGKTVALDRLLTSVRERGDKAVIYDPELEYIAKHYDPETDVILNPFDDRSPSWSPFYDAVDIVEWDRLAHGLFKDPKSGDPYWSSVARSLFAWTCYCLKRQDPNVTLWTALDYLYGKTSRLERLLKGTPAAKHLAGGGGRVGSLESVLTEGVTPLIYLLDDSRPRFSIRSWVNAQKRQPGFMFMSAPETHAATLRPLLGFWSEITVTSLLSRGADAVPFHPTWVFLDEFQSLGRIDALAEGPNRVRKYGGSMVFGLQQVSQIQDIYGRERALTIMGQCLNKLILRCADTETAQLMSNTIGERVMHRMQENTSYGANAIRDGVGIAPREDKEPIYLPTDLLNLPSLQGVIRVSNKRKGAAFPVAPVTFTPDIRDEVAPRFVRKTNDDSVIAFIDRMKAKPIEDDEFDFEEVTASTASASGGPTLVSPDGEIIADGNPDQVVVMSADISDLPTEAGRAQAVRQEDAERDRVREALNQSLNQPNRDQDQSKPTEPDRPIQEGEKSMVLGELMGDFGARI